MSDLWAVHVLGPDDIVAAPSREAAEKAAAAVCKRFAAGDPPITAVAIPWQGSDEAYKREVVEFAEYFGDWGDQPAAGGE